MDFLAAPNLLFTGMSVFKMMALFHSFKISDLYIFSLWEKDFWSQILFCVYNTYSILVPVGIYRYPYVTVIYSCLLVPYKLLVSLPTLSFYSWLISCYRYWNVLRRKKKGSTSTNTGKIFLEKITGTKKIQIVECHQYHQ